MHGCARYVLLLRISVRTKGAVLASEGEARSGIYANRLLPQGGSIQVNAALPYRAALAALELRFLLQHRADRRGVVEAVTHADRLLVDRHGRAEQRRRHLELLRVAADHVHVLLPDIDLHGGFVVAVLHHHRRAQLEDARVADTAGDEV